MVKFDDIIKQVNGFGKYQKLKFALICIAAIIPGIATYLHSFVAANPNHR